MDHTPVVMKIKGHVNGTHVIHTICMLFVCTSQLNRQVGRWPCLMTYHRGKAVIANFQWKMVPRVT